MKNSEIFILKTSSDVIAVTKHLSLCYKILLTVVNPNYHNQLLSYTQYYRYLVRYNSIVIPVLFSPPITIQRTLCYGNMPKSLFPNLPQKDIKILRERNCSVGAQQVG